jgi:predicted DNA-binding transcriptional regulator AlpA
MSSKSSSYTRLALSAADAAKALGIGRKKFLKMVEVGQMPGPRRIARRMRWDVREIRKSFLALKPLSRYRSEYIETLLANLTIARRGKK